MSKVFNIIYADPPWQYRVWSKKGMGRSAESHYQTMSLEQIQGLPIRSIAASDCALFLWVTAPCLLMGIDVIRAWGFIYKTIAFTWVKRNRKSRGWFWGMGYWTRANSELCLLATRGNPRRISARVHQVIDTPVEDHSRKPDEARERIVALMGDIPRVELFARETKPGWSVWGNEVKSDIAL